MTKLNRIMAALQPAALSYDISISALYPDVGANTVLLELVRDRNNIAMPYVSALVSFIETRPDWSFDPIPEHDPLRVRHLRYCETWEWCKECIAMHEAKAPIAAHVSAYTASAVVLMNGSDSVIVSGYYFYRGGYWRDRAQEFKLISRDAMYSIDDPSYQQLSQYLLLKLIVNPAFEIHEMNLKTRRNIKATEVYYA